MLINRIKIYCELYSYVCGLTMYEEVYTPHLAALSLHRHIQMYMYPSLPWPQCHLALSAISYSCSTTSAVQPATCRFYTTLRMCRRYISLSKEPIYQPANHIWSGRGIPRLPQRTKYFATQLFYCSMFQPCVGFRQLRTR